MRILALENELTSMRGGQEISLLDVCRGLAGKGHQVTLATRRRGVIIRPLGDVVVLMPAPAMPVERVRHLCNVVIESIAEVV